MSTLASVTDHSFEAEVLQSPTPVLVDFWAEWCGPCRMIAPLLESASAEYAGKVKIVKLNVDQNTITAAKYGVRAIPTLIIYKDGKMVSTKTGSLSKTQLTEFLDSHL